MMITDNFLLLKSSGTALKQGQISTGARNMKPKQPDRVAQLEAQS